MSCTMEALYQQKTISGFQHSIWATLPHWKKVRYKVVVYTRYKGESKVRPRTGHEGPEGSRYSCTLSLTSALDGVGGHRHAPAALSPGKTRYPLYRRLGGPQGRSGQMRKISFPPGFDPQTVHPVTSCYTDWAIPAHKVDMWLHLFVTSAAILGWVVKIVLPPLDCRDPNPVSIK